MKKLDFTRPVQQRDGETVEIICTTADYWVGGVHFPIIGICARMMLRSYMADGRFRHDAECGYDLINVPGKRRVVGWMNVYPEGTTSAPYRSKKAADGHCLSTRIACIPIDIEFTEGDGLGGGDQ